MHGETKRSVQESSEASFAAIQRLQEEQTNALEQLNMQMETISDVLVKLTTVVSSMR